MPYRGSGSGMRAAAIAAVTALALVVPAVGAVAAPRDPARPVPSISKYWWSPWPGGYPPIVPQPNPSVRPPVPR